MRESNEGSKFPIKIWCNPLSDELILEAYSYPLGFDDITELRDFAFAILNEVNRVEHSRLKPKKGFKKGRPIGKRYAAKAIQDWENLISDQPVSLDQ